MEYVEREFTMSEALELATDEHDMFNDSSRSGSDEFSKATWEESVKMATDGYSTGTRALRRRLSTLPPALHDSIRPRPVWGVSGSTVDIGRFLAGEQENMVDVRRSRRQSLVLRIAVERAVSAGVSAADIETVGASVLAVVERLRTAGVASEVWVTFTQRGKFGGRNGATYQLRIKVQDAGRPIDMDRLAFWLMHPAALRRIAFAIEEMEPASVRETFGFGHVYGGGYGWPDTYHAEGFDEYAPAKEYEVESWITDVLGRRTA
jgi:hypothetical protein